MATNPKLLEGWGDASGAAMGAYMLSNRLLREVLPTTPTRNFRRSIADEGNFMGVRFVWSRSEGEKFPAPVSAAFAQLESFANLDPNWDSYGGKALQEEAVSTIVELVFEGHRWCSMPDLHPLSGGGVSLKWHRGDRALEVQVAADGSLDALLEDPAADDVELPRKARLDDLKPLLTKFFG